MSDPLGTHGSGGKSDEPVDGELDVKAIVYVGVGTVVVTLVSMLLVW